MRQARRAVVALMLTVSGVVSSGQSIFQYRYDEEPYRLAPGPHLFADWRYVSAGRTLYLGADGKEPAMWGRRSAAGIVPAFLQMPFGVTLRAMPAAHVGPIVANDRPWEHIIGAYSTLIVDDGRFRLWYEVTPPGSEGETNLLCYAESRDGVTWEKPLLDVQPYESSMRTNIVFGGTQTPRGFHGASVFVDPHGPAEERFKLVYMGALTEPAFREFKQKHPDSITPIGEAKRNVILAAVSPDGLHWRELGEPLLGHSSDTQTTVYWDTVRERYVGYFRLATTKRAIARAETSDFRSWPAPDLMLWPGNDDDPTDDYYTGGETMYPGSKTAYLAFPSIYRRRIDSTHVTVLSSLDGRLWTTVPGKPVLEPGAPGTWDQGGVFAGIGLVNLPGDRIALPYAGYARPHKFPRFDRLGEIGLAVWPAERLVALEAREEGELYTIPIALTGKRLYLNYETDPGGTIRVELTKSSDPVRSFTLADSLVLTGNEKKRLVTWKGVADLPYTEAVQFRFRLRAARLYSFEVR